MDWPLGDFRSVGSLISLLFHLLAPASACQYLWRSAFCFSSLLHLLIFCMDNLFHPKVLMPSEAQVGFCETIASYQRTCLSGEITLLYELF